MIFKFITHVALLYLLITKHAQVASSTQSFSAELFEARQGKCYEQVEILVLKLTVSK